MNGDRTTNGSQPDPVQAELESLRAEVLRLRQIERRHLTELARFAQIAEAKRLSLSRLKTDLPHVRARQTVNLQRMKKAILARMPEGTKSTLRRMRARYFP